MSILDSILEQVGGSGGVGAIAEKFGLPKDMAEKAVAALGQAHDEPGDTLTAAAAKTGLDVGKLQDIMGAIGGEGGLGALAASMKDNPQLSSVFSMIDKDGDGNPLNDIAGLAKGLFGKN